MSYLGIDTSNYKTSLAVVSDEGEIISEVSEYLEVALGERGLRQSDAFYMHSCRLPKLMAKLLEKADIHQITAIGVSERPRRQEDSYMPCFNAGINLADILSQTLQVPMCKFSHQEGHAAAIIECGGKIPPAEQFLFMHLSGGTTEFLLCKTADYGYDMNITGGTLDISIGQLLDRFGVALGLPFPSGMYIDEMASSYKGSSMPKVMPGIRILDGYFNLSGPETRLMHFASDYTENHGRTEITADKGLVYTEDLSAVCFEVMDRIAEILSKSAAYLADEYKLKSVYISGGVASSCTLRDMIRTKWNRDDISLYFGDAVLSGDNAVGTAFLARRISKKK